MDTRLIPNMDNDGVSEAQNAINSVNSEISLFIFQHGSELLSYFGRYDKPDGERLFELLKKRTIAYDMLMKAACGQ